VARACEQLPEKSRQGLRVTLLDIDDEALAAVSARLRSFLLPEQMTLVRDNLFRLAQRPKLAGLLQGADLVLCTGLFDYLDDKAAALLLGEFWRQLAPRGAAYIFNFATDNPTRAYMEWIGNWYLNYRTRDDLKQLASCAGVPHACSTLGTEPLGLGLYLGLHKPAE
jgi:extracellular factor (EF) 3-hydroxypalmitic acid methyl ester biosynthesis protein